MYIKLENTDFMNHAISELQKGMTYATLRTIGGVVGDAMGTFAPERTGALKKDYLVEVEDNYVSVEWGYRGAPTEAYAHYQYEGIVYGPNNPIFNGIAANTFRTPKGVSKYPTERELGRKHTVVLDDGRVLFIQGYTTLFSSDHWIDRARKTPQVYNPMRREVYEILADDLGERIVGKRYYR